MMKAYFETHCQFVDLPYDEQQFLIVTTVMRQKVAGGEIVKPVGHVKANPFGLKTCPLISELYVFEAFRNQGLARQMMLAIETNARHIGIESLSLFCRYGNRLAYEWYERLGYRRAACDDAYSSMGIEFMVKFL